ncbi:MAG: thiamine diphosphokinase [[Lactobacillus] timonensis]|jgi:thiamine pyrophosphokinase|uniref:thiamine diphosphokinase n=1 Tax=[Lactobacillus] timonensis TaxID=1970790 RepID=UPI000C82E459|nr:thiamine diphosphokinase [[Lactobacillus] timonensis]MCI1926005.1 thiamine diphosphokinase [[Lactobacillus] timonensis]MCI1957385.1 thiamine diphosphokinase [[Lactobacillus] timonensis]MCI1970483.1 thiamine diphosphokinase [[Lactobacillus] timonensis]MCI2006559.1 thiamine diphosphokinase [[Lactobacillus] timonensis]
MKEVSTVNLMVGGPQQLIPWQEVDRKANQPWVAVDYGAVRLVERGIIPQYALGDFDSSTDKQRQAVKEAVGNIQQFPPEKDYTDTQLGLLTVQRHYQYDQVCLYGATGGRLDHLLANLFLPLAPAFRQSLPKLVMRDCGNTVRFFLPGSYCLTREAGMKYLAFVNLTAVEGLTLVDEKYPLDNWNCSYPVSWTSNEFNGEENHFLFKSGIVAVIQCRDVFSTLSRKNT